MLEKIKFDETVSEIAPNTLVLGDCLDAMSKIPDGSVDLILTDPPYGTTDCKWDNVIPLDLMWKELNRVIKPNGAIVLFGSEPFSTNLRFSNLKNYRYDWIWNKSRPSNFPLAKKQPMRYHEIISVFSLKSHRYYPIMRKGEKIRKKGTNNGAEVFSGGLEKEEYKSKEYIDYYPRSIIQFPNPNNGSLHPTQKPVPLLEYLIRTYTLEGETVLDFTMGSGSTGVACINTNRKFIGIELDSKYFDIAEKRLKAAEIDKLSELF